MRKIAVLFADGFEESEALTVVDVLRRAGMDARIAGVTGGEVTGAHGVRVKADCLLGDVSASDTDMAVIPGGYGGVSAMENSAETVELLRDMHAAGKKLAAICAGPRVLDPAGALDGRRYTCYPGQQGLISSGTYADEPVVEDGNVITAAGPALCCEFAYALVDALGGDSLAVKNRMVYFNAFDVSSRRRGPACPGTVRVPERPARAAVLMKEGFEEGETFSIVDILRRLGAVCDTFCFDGGMWVRGMHGMLVRADRRFGGDIESYDAVVLPGGRPGGQNLKDDPQVLDLLKRWSRTPGKTVGALCSGTTVLAAADVIKGKRMTGYTGYAEKLPGALFEESLTVTDGDLVTSQGPATGYPFAFALAEHLGYDTSCVRSRLMYAYAGGKDA